MADRAPARINAEIHAEAQRLADEYGIGIGEFEDTLLAYVIADVSRVDMALEERRARGSQAARKRRKDAVT